MTDVFRRVSDVIDPEFVIEGAGVKLRRSFGPSRKNAFDPFLLFDHFAFNDPIEGPIVGFPQHPHRGIETVTYMLEGSTRHRDSLGNSGVIGAGDVQWMTSGRGILHEELPRRGPDGKVDGFQLWVNLPAAHKMDAPRYQEIRADEIPCMAIDGGELRLIAGELKGSSGPVAEIAAQPLYLDVRLDPDGLLTLDLPDHHTAAAYVFEGEAEFGRDNSGGGEIVRAVRMAVFSRGDKLSLKAGGESGVRFVLFAGLPFNEPIVPHGPFVMNTEAEIRQALQDLRNGTFIDGNAFAAE
jgi:redox-sensitive bicupin YhaK (pirin superfamily)